jgi:hypothetical protein
LKTSIREDGKTSKINTEDMKEEGDSPGQGPKDWLGGMSEKNKELVSKINMFIFAFFLATYLLNSGNEEIPGRDNS